ncbi:hypothetical protein LTR08_008003 [Meristemomyces frigidus]|nr:hypothetical protein LTR08_008003 [Meristemomyces frigidus]
MPEPSDEGERTDTKTKATDRGKEFLSTMTLYHVKIYPDGAEGWGILHEVKAEFRAQDPDICMLDWEHGRGFDCGVVSPKEIPYNGRAEDSGKFRGKINASLVLYAKDSKKRERYGQRPLKTLGVEVKAASLDARDDFE